jgi:nucleoid-associated protein YgaU
MQFGDPARGSHCKLPSAFCCGLLLLSIGAFRCPAQDVAEAARQEKARKATDPGRSHHVYTDEDLKRSIILTPEDRARVEAHRVYPNHGPSQQNAQALPTDLNELSSSLGEIARRYREEKAAREAQLAVEKRFAPFPYLSPGNSLADPKLAVEPLTVPVAAVPSAHLTLPVFPASHPAVPSHSRISPFQPRPLVPAPSASPASASPIMTVPVRVPDAPPSVVNSNTPPALDGFHRVQVQRGQSWWKLAQLYLGNGARWRELRALNANVSKSSDVLELGTTVVVPQVLAASPEQSTGTVRVSRGDSLWSLALKYLGRGSAWHCLASANPQVLNYARLEIGVSLQLPEADALNSCVQKPDVLKSSEESK